MTEFKSEAEENSLCLSDIVVLGFIFASLFFPMNMAAAGKNAGLLVLSSVLPALFPFLVLGQMLVFSGLGDKIGKRLGFLMPVFFALPNGTFPILLLGLFSGFPVGAIMTEQLYAGGKISKNEGERLIAFSNNASFAFVVGVVGSVLGNVSYGLLLYFSSVAAALCVGMFLSLFAAKRGVYLKCEKEVKKKGFSVMLVEAVGGGVRTSIEIMGFVVFFSVVLELLKNINAFSILKLFGTELSEKMLPLAYGFFDMTNGVFAVLQSGGALNVKLLSLALILGFSSLSVLFQIISVVVRQNFSLKFLVVGKVLQSLLTLLFVYVFSALPIFSKPAFLPVGASRFFAPEPRSAVLIFVITCACCAGIFALFCLTFKKK